MVLSSPDIIISSPVIRPRRQLIPSQLIFSDIESDVHVDVHSGMDLPAAAVMLGSDVTPSCEVNDLYMENDCRDDKPYINSDDGNYSSLNHILSWCLLHCCWFDVS